MKNVAVIGAGTMGNGIAHTFAQSGFNVQLIDISEEALKKGIATISKNLDRMVAKEKITEKQKKEEKNSFTNHLLEMCTTNALWLRKKRRKIWLCAKPILQYCTLKLI